MVYYNMRGLRDGGNLVALCSPFYSFPLPFYLEMGVIRLVTAPVDECLWLCVILWHCLLLSSPMARLHPHLPSIIIIIILLVTIDTSYLYYS